VDRPNGPRSPRCTNERTEGKNSKEAERRQTRRQKLHLPAQRAPCGARSPVGVPLRLSPGRQLVPKAQRQAMLSGTVRSVRSCTAAPTGGRRPCASSRALPAPEQQTNVPVQRAPRVPVIVPAGLMPKPPECGGDEPSAPRAPQPAPPALVTGRRPCKGARCTLLVRRGVWIQEIPADAVIPLMWRESFFAVCLIRRRGNCGIAAMVRIIVAKVRRVRAFLNWDNEMIRFRSEANLGPISKVGRGAKRGVRRTSLNPGYDLGSPINSETRVSPHAAALAASAAGLAAV